MKTAPSKNTVNFSLFVSCLVNNLVNKISIGKNAMLILFTRLFTRFWRNNVQLPILQRIFQLYQENDSNNELIQFGSLYRYIQQIGVLDWKGT